ncbi:hypothetical protein ACIQYF_23525 [Pseudomonas sp. NPDC096917]
MPVALVAMKTTCGGSLIANGYQALAHR